MFQFLEFLRYDEFLTMVVKKTESEVVWLHLKVSWLSMDKSIGYDEMKEKRYAEEEIERQYSGMDRNGLCWHNLGSRR